MGQLGTSWLVIALLTSTDQLVGVVVHSMPGLSLGHLHGGVQPWAPALDHPVWCWEVSYWVSELSFLLDQLFCCCA